MKNSFDELKDHIGHKVIVVGYSVSGVADEMYRVGVECRDCGRLIVAFDNEDMDYCYNCNIKKLLNDEGYCAECVAIPCFEERPINNPYEIWQMDGWEWEWRVLKKWQVDDDEPYARWFCAVRSPYTHGTWDYGDVYVAEIKEYATWMENRYNEEE